MNVTNAHFIDNLQKVFKEDTKELVLSNEVSKCKWSAFSHKLLEAWNLKEDDDNLDDEIDKGNENSQKASQDYILNQYI